MPPSGLDPRDVLASLRRSLCAGSLFGSSFSRRLSLRNWRRLDICGAGFFRQVEIEILGVPWPRGQVREDNHSVTDTTSMRATAIEEPRPHSSR